MLDVKRYHSLQNKVCRFLNGVPTCYLAQILRH